jgi:menaquinone-specific isochorismate synthase
VAVRIPLAPGAPVDPFALAGATGVVLADGERVLAGVGRAVTFDLPGGLADEAGVDAAAAALAGIACDDRLTHRGGGAGHGVVAFGALPFDRSAAGTLVVPELTYGREADGTEWVSVVGPAAGALPDPDRPGIGAELRARLVERATSTAHGDATPRRPRVAPRAGDDEFERSVAAAVAAIGRGDLVKVVLARAVDVHLDADVDVPALLRRWTGLEPSCTVFSVPTPDGRFVGASPELLVEREGPRVRCRPLAGTTNRFPDTASELPAVLLDSAKDAEEHRLVVDAVRGDLEPVTERLRVPDRPELVHLHTITHLGTTMDGTLRPGPDGSVPTALHLVARLHPTPAVGGVPRSAATGLIARLESTPRGPYAGPVGWVDGAGDGRWMVGIRAATLDGRTVRMTAGVGIVAGSDPHTELLETELKLRAVFDALAPGCPFDTSGTTDRSRRTG